MRKAAIVGLSAGLLMALNVCASEAVTPASQMVSELRDATNDCKLISLKDHLQRQSNERVVQNASSLAAMGGDLSGVNDAISAAAAEQNAKNDEFYACITSAKETGRAAYRKYQSAPNQSQTVKDDVKAVYIAWLTYLPDLAAYDPPEDSPQAADYRKALSTLEVDDSSD